MDHEEFCNLLKSNGFNFYTGIPCSILGNIINHLSKSKEFTYVPATREDEAFGIAVGAYMGGKKPVVLMQNSGLGVSINALTSLVLLYKFPILLIVSWRGYKGKDAPEHILMGKYMLSFLRIMSIPTKILVKDVLEKQLMDSIQIIRDQEVPVALVLKRGVIE
jgi:sulfopyruvate decarboxylase subunit alpha